MNKDSLNKSAALNLAPEFLRRHLLDRIDVRNAAVINETYANGTVLISGKAIDGKPGTQSFSQKTLETLGHEYGHSRLVTLTQQPRYTWGAGLTQVYYEANNRVTGAAKAENPSPQTHADYKTGMVALEATANLQLFLDATRHGEVLSQSAPNGRNIRSEIALIVERATNGNLSLIESDFALARQVTAEVGELLKKNGLSDAALQASFIRHSLGQKNGRPLAGHEINEGEPASIPVPTEIRRADGSVLSLNGELIDKWLADTLKEEGFDASQMTVHYVVIEAPQGRRGHLVYDSIQPGSFREQFNKYDPWLRESAVESMHAYWAKTSMSNQIRNNPRLQSAPVEPGPTELSADASAGSALDAGNSVGPVDLIDLATSAMVNASLRPAVAPGGDYSDLDRMTDLLTTAAAGFGVSEMTPVLADRATANAAWHAAVAPQSTQFLQ